MFKKENKKKINKKTILIIFIFFFFLTITFNYLLNKNINYNDKYLLKYVLKLSIPTYKINNNIKIDAVSLLNLDRVDIASSSKIVKDNKINNKDNNYLVYIYNTHQSEEYTDTSLVSNSISPTVVINDYIIKDCLKNSNISTLVEERSIKDILNINNLSYSGSYIASRVYLEDVKNNYNTLKYFIDIHRDSVDKNISTIDINGKNYAKILFIVGLENTNYNENLEFTESINNIINERYPGLSRGIYKKEGPGVNGVYNQDFSKYTILIEIGGNENNINEIMNTSLVIGNILAEVINNNEKSSN